MKLIQLNSNHEHVFLRADMTTKVHRRKMLHAISTEYGCKVLGQCSSVLRENIGDIRKLSDGG